MVQQVLQVRQGPQVQRVLMGRMVQQAQQDLLLDLELLPLRPDQ